MSLREEHAPSFAPLAWLAANWPAVLALIGAGISAVNAWQRASEAQRASAEAAQAVQVRVAQVQDEVERWRRLGHLASYGLLAMGVVAVVMSLRRR